MFGDQFLFIAPYPVFYVPGTAFAILALDMLLAALTGIVLVVSLRQVSSGRSKGTASTGILGIVAAIIAGACPCYYLAPLLTIAAGVGGALGAVGILMHAYEFEVKTASIVLLLIVFWALERNARMTCRLKKTTP
jgi:uncharacterized membrane protein HdeD (DUF308 family)